MFMTAILRGNPLINQLYTILFVVAVVSGIFLLWLRVTLFMLNITYIIYSTSRYSNYCHCRLEEETIMVNSKLTLEGV